MPASIGVNLRVTGHCSQGGRKYMEDFFGVAYQQTEDEKDLEYAFFGIYDGHGGGEAAIYAKEHLMEFIVHQKSFWSDKDEDVLKAIKDGYIATHFAMWKEQENWPRTASGLPSTAGTTATIAFIRRGKIYIGHVGDSGVILGYQEPGNPNWKAKPLTKDHKPENATEMCRIKQSGGKVVSKSGVPRVVWNRPRIGHKGPVRRSTPIDEIPFLAVARSLGDLWSYNFALDEFVVSPDPDTAVINIDTNTFRCLIFGTDGLWNMISPEAAVQIVQATEQHNEQSILAGKQRVWINPSESLVKRSLERWSHTRMRADNTTAVTLLLDPPGPPRVKVLRKQSQEAAMAALEKSTMSPHSEYPPSGLAIVQRYPDIQDTRDVDSDSSFYQDPLVISTPISSKNDEVSALPSFNSDENDVLPDTSISTVDNIREESIQINEISSSSCIDEKFEDTSPKKCKNKNERLRLKSREANIKEVPIGKCTRSHDVPKTDKRTRTVSSSSDKVTSPSEHLKTNRYSKRNLSRSTGALEGLLSNESGRNKQGKQSSVTAQARKRNIDIETTKNSTENIVVNERVTFPVEPSAKRIRKQSFFTQSRRLKQILNTTIIDSDQENNVTKSNNLHNMMQLRERVSLITKDTGRNERIRNRQNNSVSSTNVPSTSLGKCERNLRERNQCVDEKLTKVRNNCDVQGRLSAPGKLNKIESEKRHTVKTNKNIWLTSKSIMKTRNRVKRFSK